MCLSLFLSVCLSFSYTVSLSVCVCVCVCVSLSFIHSLSYTLSLWDTLFLSETLSVWLFSYLPASSPILLHALIDEIAPLLPSCHNLLLDLIFSVCSWFYKHVHKYTCIWQNKHHFNIWQNKCHCQTEIWFRKENTRGKKKKLVTGIFFSFPTVFSKRFSLGEVIVHCMVISYLFVHSRGHIFC